ncbi:MAG: glutamine--fructose-6-phosphate transaminase (isomerizing) [Candidatus Nomurabacteria bacterium]|jgi:glucosamine--fructose-6-phosphate aminotransferase (isomerizing)|nr:glutamine--fructose-6-phosphate transaminase (isomerizing) [Candidatus Nomurabacteria bacterium]
MCGIVGYVGEKRNAQDVLVNGLKRLEYRGYDSAGIATLDEKGEAHLARSVGKIVELEQVLLEESHTGKIGIGHTRWATHGGVTVENAHPHSAGDVYLVHNGIIENYKELKAKLKEHKFTSDTDTEVLAALVDSNYGLNISLKDAVAKSLKQVRGTYGIAVISPREPGVIVVARLGSPLIIGVGKDETIIASDASALLGYTREAIYLNDGELAVCTKDSVDVYNLSLKPQNHIPEQIEGDLEQIQKGGYPHFLIKEIMEQSSTLGNTLKGRIDTKTGKMHLGGPNLTQKEMQSIKHIVIVGCGTAYYAGLLASYYLEQLVPELTTEVVIASEYRYRSFHIPKNSVALIVSQSGETADTLACLREIKKRGVKTLGIVNVVGSTIAREVDGGTYVHAGPEISVASTKAFTAQVVTMLLFGGMLAEHQGGSPQLLNDFVQELAKLPSEIEKTLRDYAGEIGDLAKKYAKYDDALYLGRDTAYPISLEGALKLKEISYIHAEGYASGELKHGPIALVDENTFEIFNILDNWLYDKSLGGLHEVRARGGKAIVLTDAAKEKQIEADDIVRIETPLKHLVPILLNTLQQLFAYHVAVARGNDVDQPRNLAKSVTVE